MVPLFCSYGTVKIAEPSWWLRSHCVCEICIDYINGKTYVPKVVYICCLLTMYTTANQRPTVIFIRTLLFLSFCYAPASLFFLYIPHKNPLSMIKYELSTYCRWCLLSWVQLHQQTGKAIAGSAKIAHPQTLLRTSAKNSFHKCGKTILWVSTKCAYNRTVTVSVRVSVTVRVSLVWLVSGNNLVALCIVILWMKYITLSCTLCCPLTMYTTANQRPELTSCT